MRARRAKIIFSALVFSGLSFGLCVFGLKWRVHQAAGPLMKTLETVESAPAALIFGAYVSPNGTPCPLLQDRLQTGCELYRQGLAKKLILSGDHGSTDYDEVNAMRIYLEKQGIPKEALFLDHAGFDTYDSLYRAREIFGAENLILVTQDFHLKRALYIGQSLGLKVQGVSADRRLIPEIKSLQRRELAANVKALWDLKSGRKPVHLGVQLSLDTSGEITHDK